MNDFTLALPREQIDLPTEPYDRWIVGEGEDEEEKAQFFRTEKGYLVRFPEEIDFTIDADDWSVTAIPVPGTRPDIADSLFANAIAPILGNHHGGIFLHGSAVAMNGKGVAFLGQSRSGKTTLAAACARAGHPFLTEDVIELKQQGDAYFIQPKARTLRLFKDSAEFLGGEQHDWATDDVKQRVALPADTPFSETPVTLSRLFILADHEPEHPELPQLAAQNALAQLMPHSFILDVEDRQRLKAHFARLADLSQSVACHSLDYTRDYGELPRVISAIGNTVSG